MSLTSYQPAPPRALIMPMRRAESNSKKRLPICVRGRKSHLPQEMGRAKFTPLTRRQTKIQRSSVVERSAVNRLVVGSNPTAGGRPMFRVYILKNPSGSFYVGHTSDLDGRICNHNRVDKISGKFTRKNGPWILV